MQSSAADCRLRSTHALASNGQDNPSSHITRRLTKPSAWRASGQLGVLYGGSGMEQMEQREVVGVHAGGSGGFGDGVVVVAILAARR